jgi:carboxypeptidase PM20D1
MIALYIAFVIFIIGLLVVLIRTALFHVKNEGFESGEFIDVDEGWVANTLSGAIKFATLADTNKTNINLKPFDQLYAHLQKAFPLVSQKCERIRVLYPSWVYRWQGKQKDLKPIVLMGHVDVVPADPESLKSWKHDPFSGDIAGGQVWGRGTLDDKGPVVTMLAAAELLLKQGFTPERTIYFAFGYDEECLGKNGAARIVEWFKKQKIDLEVVLDEGAGVVDNVFPGLKGRLGLIDTAEKGYMTIMLRVESAGGHSATPGKQTSISILAKAIARLEDHPMSARLGIVMELFKNIGQSLPWIYRLVFANRWLFSRFIRKSLEKSGMTNAAIRTTIVATMIHGGIRPNVLPSRVEAAINVRLLPGDTSEEVINHIQKTIADDRVVVEPVLGYISEASPISMHDHPAYGILKNAIRQAYGDIPIAPFVVIGATDARYYAPICNNIYRFAPYKVDSEGLKSVHGLNERISVKILGKMVQIYAQVIRGWSRLK